MQLELYVYLHLLTFIEEYYLSEDHLRVDVLISKNKSGIKIEKNIGRIFEDYNIFEFKSMHDSLSKWDYIKGMGYANLYASIEKKSPENITVSFVCNRHPRKLFKYLQNERGLTIEEEMKGIYYVKGDALKVQIIECKKLSKQENLFLTNVRRDLTPHDLSYLIDQEKKYDSDLLAAYLKRIMNANAKILEEVVNMKICPETYSIFDKANDTLGLKKRYQAEGKAEGEAKGKAEGIAEGIAKGRIKVYHEDLQLSPEEISDKINLPLNKVVEIIKTLQIAT